MGDRIVATILILTFATLLIIGCRPGYVPIPSSEVDLKSEDLGNGIKTLPSESITGGDLGPLFMLNFDAFSDLEEDITVTEGLHNGVWSFHGEPRGMGNTCITLQITSWVLSFRTSEAAQRAYQLLAKPEPAGALSTGERELPLGRLGDESAVYDHVLGPGGLDYKGLPGSGETYYRVVSRSRAVVVAVQASCVLDPYYVRDLVGKMIERAEALQPVE